MPVPSTAADLSTTAASNSPAGADAIGTSLDDYLRSIQAIIKQQDSKGSDIASATTIDVPSSGKYFVVTGTTTIAGISDDWNGRSVILKFSGALQLTHSASLILPTSANITTAAGDCLMAVNESTGVWRVVAYQRADGTALSSVTSVPPISNVLAPHKGLINKYASASTVSVAATSLVLLTSGGTAKSFSSLSATLDITASGAAGLDTGAEANSTWYHIWGIGKTDGTVSAVFSTSTSAPTLPSGYTYYGYLGAAYNNSSGNFDVMFQRGNITLTGGTANVLTNGVQTNYTSISLTGHVPSTATAVRLRVEVNSSSGTNVVQINVAPAGTGTGAGTYGNLSTFGSYGATGTPLSDMRCEMETAQQIVYRVSGTNAQGNIVVQGWVF